MKGDCVVMHEGAETKTMEANTGREDMMMGKQIPGLINTTKKNSNTLVDGRDTGHV